MRTAQCHVLEPANASLSKHLHPFIAKSVQLIEGCWSALDAFWHPNYRSQPLAKTISMRGQQATSLLNKNRSGTRELQLIAT